jgi:hypothetical protein
MEQEIAEIIKADIRIRFTPENFQEQLFNLRHDCRRDKGSRKNNFTLLIE